MKRYIKANDDSKEYIGGRLADMDYDAYRTDDAYYDALDFRFDTQSRYISEFASDYIVYFPDRSVGQFDCYLSVPNLLFDVTEGMAVKDGIDVIAQTDHIEVVAYDGNGEEIVKLYPISGDIAYEIESAMEHSDFDVSTVIEGKIAQHAWSGASIEDVLKSWG